MLIKIATDFSENPGGRYIEEGDFSGELFRDTVLYPKYKQALEKGETLTIDFDGCFGFGTSFLEEAFGGMVRKYQVKNQLNHIIIISTEDETIPDLIRKYVISEEKKL